MIFSRRLFRHFLPFLPALPHDQQIAIAALAHGGLRYCPERLVQHRLHGANLCNHSLLSAMAAAQAKAAGAQTRPERDRETRLIRRLRHRRTLYRKLDYYCARGLAPAHWLPLVDPTCFDAQWFEPRLFWLLLRHPALVGHPPLLRRLKRAYKHSKGGRWYSLTAAWASEIGRAHV